MLQSSPSHRRVGSTDSLIVGSERAGGGGPSPSLRRSSVTGGIFGPLPTSPWHQPLAAAQPSSASGVANSRGSPYSAHSFFAGHDAEALSLTASAAAPSSVSMHPMPIGMHSQMQAAPSPNIHGFPPPLLAGLGLSDFDPSPLSLGEMHRAGLPLTPVRAISAVVPAEVMPSPVSVTNVRSSSRKRSASLLAREAQASAMELSDPEEAEESPRASAPVFPAATQQPTPRFQSARPSALAVAALPTASARLAAPADSDDDVKPISHSKPSRATAAAKRRAPTVSDSGSDNNSGDSGAEGSDAEADEDDFASEQDEQQSASDVSSDVSFSEAGSRRKGKAGAKKASSRSKGGRTGRKQEPKKRAAKPAASAAAAAKKAASSAAAAAAAADDDASVSSSPDAADDAAMEDGAGGGGEGGDCSPMACGRLLPDGTRIFEEHIPFFGRVVELYTATLDPLQRVLVRASTLAARFSCATNKVGMYLSRRRQVSDGLFQAKSFLHKPAGRTGLKAGGYFLSHEVCLAFEAHYSKHSTKGDDKGAAAAARGAAGGGGRSRSAAAKRAAASKRKAAAAGEDGAIPESQHSPLVGTDKAVAREAAAQGLTLSQVSPRLKISPTQRLEGPYSTGGWPVSAAIAPEDQSAAAAKESASAPVRKRKLASSVKKEKDDGGVAVKLEPQSHSVDSSLRHLPRDTLIIVKQEVSDSKPQKKQRNAADAVSRSQPVIAQTASRLQVPQPTYATDSPPSLSQPIHSRPPSSTSMSYRSSATTTAANSQAVTPRMMDSHSPRAGMGMSYPAMAAHGLHPPQQSSSGAAGFFGGGEGSLVLMDEHNTQDLYARARKPHPQPQPMQQMPAQALAQHAQHAQQQAYINHAGPNGYVDYQQQMRHHQQQQHMHASARQHGHTLAVPLHPGSSQHSQQSSQQSSPNPLASLNLSSDSIRSLQAKVEQALRTLQAAQGTVPNSAVTSSASSVSDYTQIAPPSAAHALSFDAPFVSSSVVPLAALSSSHPQQPHPLLFGANGDPSFFQSTSF